MAVSITLYNHTPKLLFNKEVNLDALRAQLLSNSATFDATHTSKPSVDNGSSATVTMTIASPAVISHTGHGFTAGKPVLLTTTGALPTGFTAGTTYYVVNPNTDDYQLAATPGGAAINSSGSQSGVHTAWYAGSYEVAGNNWTPFGEPIANATVTTVTTNDTKLDGDDVSKTATGGPIGPARKALVYDWKTMKPLAFVDFGEDEEAGEDTDFKIVWHSNGIVTGTYTPA
jgi:hypothetical protein